MRHLAAIIDPSIAKLLAATLADIEKRHFGVASGLREGLTSREIAKKLGWQVQSVNAILHPFRSELKAIREMIDAASGRAAT